MENVPKIVRHRLKVPTPLVSHPDADALTALAEQSLPERERAGLLEHLSRCTECREVVALALPPVEPVAAAAESPSRLRLLTWPALRWGFAAAGLLVILSLGVLQYQRTSHKTMMAKVPQAAVTEARNETLPAVHAPEPSSPPLSKERDKLKDQVPLSSNADAKQLPAMLLKSPSPPQPATGGPLLTASGGAFGRGVSAHGPRMLTQLQQNAIAQQVQAPAAISPAPAPYARQGNAPAAASRETVPVVSQSAVIQPGSANLQSSQVTTSEPARAYDYAEAKVEKTKPAETFVNNVSPRMDTGSVPLSGQSMTALSGQSARWRITVSGGLQRSLDQGNTWQDVDVQGSKSDAAGKNFKVAAKPSATPAKKLAPSDVQNAPAVFRAIAASGTDVWAGGSQALLYHSTDAGNHWSRVIPASDSVTLTGDILSLDFPDSQHGTIATSASQVWTTSDGGQTWQPQ